MVACCRHTFHPILNIFNLGPACRDDILAGPKEELPALGNRTSLLFSSAAEVQIHVWMSGYIGPTQQLQLEGLRLHNTQDIQIIALV